MANGLTNCRELNKGMIVISRLSNIKKGAGHAFQDSKITSKASVIYLEKKLQQRRFGLLI